MNKLYYSPKAFEDLDEIWTYIMGDLGSPAAAQNTITNILNSIEKLQEFPEMGPSLSSVTEIESNYRFLVCGICLAFYRVKGTEINIDRILYSRRDYIHILFGNTSEYAISRH